MSCNMLQRAPMRSFPAINPLHPRARRLAAWWPTQEGGGAVLFDASGNGRHVTMQGNTWSWITTRLGYGIKDAFSSTDYGTLARNLSGGNTDNFTASMWLNWGIDNDTTRHAHLTCDGGSTRNSVNTISQSAEMHRTYGDDYGQDLACPLVVTHGISPFGVSRHYVAVREGSDFSSYVDGQFLETDSAAGDYVWGNIDRIFAGTAVDADDVQVTNMAIWIGRALTPSLIAQLYRNPWGMGRLQRRHRAVTAAVSAKTILIGPNEPNASTWSIAP